MATFPDPPDSVEFFDNPDRLVCSNVQGAETYHFQVSKDIPVKDWQTVQNSPETVVELDLSPDDYVCRVSTESNEERGEWGDELEFSID